MELVIYKQNTFQAIDFIRYLCNLVKQLLLSSNIEFGAYNNYFAKEFTSDITAQNILIAAGLNLDVKNYGDIIIIKINENVMFNNSQIRLIDLCKLLNNGTLEIRGTNVFSDTFDYIANNMDQIYLTYILEM